MKRIIIALCALTIAVAAAEKGAKALIRNTQRDVSTNQTPVTIISGGQTATLWWDVSTNAVSYDLIIRAGKSDTDPIVAATNELQNATTWLMQQTASGNRVQFLWVRAIGARGQTSAWAGPIGFLKLQ